MDSSGKSGVSLGLHGHAGRVMCNANPATLHFCIIKLGVIGAYFFIFKFNT